MSTTRRVKAILEAEDRATPAFSRVAAGVAALGAAAVAAGAVAIGKTLVNGINSAVKAAAEQEAAEVKLAQAIKLSGQSVSDTLSQMKKYASAMQDLSGYGDEAILNQQALLISIGKLRGEGLEEATRAALDFAAATGRDINTSFLLMAKAAAGNTAELSRYGIVLGDNVAQADKFKTVLKLVSEQFGGQAAAQLATYDGRLREMQGRFGDLAEVIGGPFKDVWTEVMGTAISPFIKELTNAADGSNLLRVAVFDLAIGILNLIEPIERVIRSEFFKQVMGAGVAAAVIQIIRFREATEEVPKVINDLGNALFDIVGKVTPVAQAAKAMGEGFAEGAAIANPELQRTVTLIEQLVANLEYVRDNPTVIDSGGGGAQATIDPVVEEDALQEAMILMQELVDANPITVTIVPPTLDEYSGETLDEFNAKEQYKLDVLRDSAKKNVKIDKDRNMALAQQGAALARTVFKDSKAAQYASTIISTADAVMRALAFPPGPPATIPMAALTAAMGAAQLATIAGANYQTGGFVEGVSVGRDTVPANLQPGEFVLSRADVESIVTGSIGGGAQQISIALHSDIPMFAEMMNDGVRTGNIRLLSSELVSSRSVR